MRTRMLAGALALALVGATVFAVWPVVADAPWLGGKPAAPSTAPLLSWDQAVAAVTWQALLWCADRKVADAEACVTSMLGAPECKRNESWTVYFHPDQHIWRVFCGGRVFLVDDNTGRASGPTLP
jgi:hypothetical protein